MNKELNLRKQNYNTSPRLQTPAKDKIQNKTKQSKYKAKQKTKQEHIYTEKKQRRNTL